MTLEEIISKVETIKDNPRWWVLVELAKVARMRAREIRAAVRDGLGWAEALGAFVTEPSAKPDLRIVEPGDRCETASCPICKEPA